VRFAREQFGLEGVSGDIRSLERHPERYDVLVLSDVLYYQPGLGDVWSILTRLLKPEGALVLRVPNKLAVIRARRLLSKIAHAGRRPGLEDRIRHFNPEHIYVFSGRYLRSRLRACGFSSIRVEPSPPLFGDHAAGRTLAAWLFSLAQGVSLASQGRLVLTPSMLVVGSGLKAASI
jgi:hypothetical protein